MRKAWANGTKLYDVNASAWQIIKFVVEYDNKSTCYVTETVMLLWLMQYEAV